MSFAAKKRFIRAIADALARIGLPAGSRLMVAVSGGSDSVALLYAMLALRDQFGFTVSAAHLNHRIRAAESDRDENFVRELCDRLQIDLIVECAQGLFPTTPNLEERAREARMRFLTKAASLTDARYIALGHQADDQAETVIMRLLRGSGAAGLGAIRERGPGRFIRPMLALARADAFAYLETLGEVFVSDTSNLSTAILRNRVRLELLPMLEREYAPGLCGRLVELATEMRALEDFVTSAARAEAGSMRAGRALDLTRFNGLCPALQGALLRLFLAERLGSLRSFGRAHIEAVRRLCLCGPPNGVLNLPGGIRIAREYGFLRIAETAQPAVAFSVRIAEQGRTDVPQALFVFDSSIVSPENGIGPRDKSEAHFDAAAAAGCLTVRSPLAGDRIAPLGLSGHRKLKDVFIDAKVAKLKRIRFPVVELNGEIAWLPGIVRARVALVTEATQKVLRVRAREIDANTIKKTAVADD